MSVVFGSLALTTMSSASDANPMMTFESVDLETWTARKEWQARDMLEE